MALETMMAATNRSRPPQAGHCEHIDVEAAAHGSAQVRLYEPPTFRGVVAEDAR